MSANEDESAPSREQSIENEEGPASTNLTQQDEIDKLKKHMEILIEQSRGLLKLESAEVTGGRTESVEGAPKVRPSKSQLEEHSNENFLLMENYYMVKKKLDYSNATCERQKEHIKTLQTEIKQLANKNLELDSENKQLAKKNQELDIEIEQLTKDCISSKAETIAESVKNVAIKQQVGGKNDDRNSSTEDGENSSQNAEVPRSLASNFVSVQPFCLAAVPYERVEYHLYVNTGGETISKDFEDDAKQKFGDAYKIVDFNTRFRGEAVTPNSLPEEQRKKILSEVDEVIDKHLNLFEDRLNVTGLEASFTVVDSIEQETPCVRVFVLEKGEIPVGETTFSELEKQIGYKLEVAEGYYQPAHGPNSPKSVPTLYSGAKISARGTKKNGTLGGFLLDDEEKPYLLSADHVLNQRNPDIVHNARPIGTYFCGFEGLTETGHWVDAAIAELNENVVESVKSSDVGDCPLYGFKNHQSHGFTPNGEVAAVNESLPRQLETFTYKKLGASSGFTESEKIYGIPRIRNNNPDSQLKWFTKEHCIITRGTATRPFCKEGDSGSLFFGDDKQARGLFFGLYPTNNVMYCLASHLGKCLQKLEQLKGNSKLRLWVKQPVERPPENCGQKESADEQSLIGSEEEVLGGESAQGSEDVSKILMKEDDNEKEKGDKSRDEKEYNMEKSDSEFGEEKETVWKSDQESGTEKNEKESGDEKESNEKSDRKSGNKRVQKRDQDSGIEENEAKESHDGKKECEERDEESEVEKLEDETDGEKVVGKTENDDESENDKENGHKIGSEEETSYKKRKLSNEEENNRGDASTPKRFCKEFQIKASSD